MKRSSYPESNTQGIEYGPVDNPHEEEEVDVPTESKISKVLSDRTTKIVIILVLVMLFA